MGKKLFEVRSQEDLSFALDAYSTRFYGSFWIGVVQVNGQWVYDSDGEPFVGLWAPERPVGVDIYRRTLVSNNGIWDDTGGSDRRGYLCEWL